MTNKMIARTLDDILAVVPVTFGFQPEESLVMLASGSDKAVFQARSDLEPSPAGQQALADYLVDAAIANDRNRLVLLLYTDDAELAEGQARQCLRAATAGGLEVVTAVRVDKSRCYSLRAIDPMAAFREPQGRPYDTAEHPFTLQAKYDGRVIHRNRAEMAGELADFDAGDAKQIERALQKLRRTNSSAVVGKREQARWLQTRLRQFVTDRQRLTVDDAARVLDLISNVILRDVAWVEIQTHNRAWLELWLDLTKRSSLLADPDRTAPAALLAFAAWQAGDGAVAWCAVTQCLDIDPDYSMAHLVADVLSQALPPETWTSPDHSQLDVFADSRYADQPDSSAS